MQQAEIHAEVLDGELWSEVDDPTDLRLAEFKFNPAARYALLESTWGGSWDLGVLDFAFIRNMHFPTPAMFSELRFHLPELLQNYGSSQVVLDTKLSWALRWPEAHTHLLAGASQAYPWLRRVVRGQAGADPRARRSVSTRGSSRTPTATATAPASTGTRSSARVRGRRGRRLRQPEQPDRHDARERAHRRIRAVPPGHDRDRRRVVHRVLRPAARCRRSLPGDGLRQRPRAQEPEQEPRGARAPPRRAPHARRGAVGPDRAGDADLELELGGRELPRHHAEAPSGAAAVVPAHRVRPRRPRRDAGAAADRRAGVPERGELRARPAVDPRGGDERADRRGWWRSGSSTSRTCPTSSRATTATGGWPCARRPTTTASSTRSHSWCIGATSIRARRCRARRREGRHEERIHADEVLARRRRAGRDRPPRGRAARHVPRQTRHVPRASGRSPTTRSCRS